MKRKWLIAGVLTFGMAPVSVQAQNMGAMRLGGFGTRPPLPGSAYANPFLMNRYTMNSYMANRYMMNPYMMNGYMMSGMSSNPYMSGNSYGSGSSSMSPGTSGGSSGYGGQGYGGQGGGMGYGQPSTGQTASMSAATLFGLPAENGHVQWPLGLRILPPETKPLRDQLDLALYFVASQAAEGQANRTFIDSGLEAVRDLRKLTRPREGVWPAATYADAMRFLDRAERGLTKIKKNETKSGAAYP
jgi:hypothetical protein